MIRCLIFIVVLSSCKTKQPIQNNTVEISENCTWNNSKDYYLCVDEKTKESGDSYLAYRILDLNSELVLEDMIAMGSVKWLDDLAIVVYATPRVISVDETNDDYKKVYDIRTSKWSPYRQYLNQKSE